MRRNELPATIKTHSLWTLSLNNDYDDINEPCLGHGYSIWCWRLRYMVGWAVDLHFASLYLDVGRYRRWNGFAKSCSPASDGIEISILLVSKNTFFFLSTRFTFSLFCFSLLDLHRSYLISIRNWNRYPLIPHQKEERASFHKYVEAGLFRVHYIRVSRTPANPNHEDKFEALRMKCLFTNQLKL